MDPIIIRQFATPPPPRQRTKKKKKKTAMRMAGGTGVARH